MIRHNTMQALRQRRRAMGMGSEASEGAAAAVVLAAIEGASADLLSRLLDDAEGNAAVCRWVAETDAATVLPGYDGRWIATRIEEQRSEWFASLADALVWSLRGAVVATPKQQDARSAPSAAKPYRYTE